MAKKIREIKELIRRIMEPIGVDEEKDQAQLNRFLDVIELLTNLGWFLIGLCAVMSFYFFLTREIL